MKRLILELLLIVSLAGTVFFTNLGKASLWDRDEPRNAGCAAEMMERGDLVVPIFNDELRHQKPVLLYWLMIGAYQLFGFSEFAARLPSAILAIGSVLATWGIARRLAGAKVAVWSAVILSTSLMFDVAARAATPDSVLIFCISMALLIFVLAVFAPFDGAARLRDERVCFPKNYFPVLAIYGMTALGVLAKGPVGLVIPMGIFGLFGLVVAAQRRAVERASFDPTEKTHSFRDRMWSIIKLVARPFHPLHVLTTLWSLRPVTAIVVVLVVAGPWYWLVDARTEGDFTRLFFVGEHFGRATTVLENHRGGLWYYPLAILVGFFPWSVFWVPVAIDLKQQAAKGFSPATILLLVWIGVQVGLFSLVQTKLPSYVTPCYGALAILTASCLINWLRQSASAVNDFWMTGALHGLLLAGILITLGTAYICVKELHGDGWIVMAGVVPMLGAASGLYFLRHNHRARVVYCSAAVAVIFSVGLFGFATVTVSNHQQSRQLLDLVYSSPGKEVAAFGAFESSWVVYSGRRVYELSPEMPLETQARVKSLVRDRKWHPKPRLTPEEFVTANPDAMIITTSELVEPLKNRLPGDFQVIQTADYFFRNKTLCLLARQSSRIAQR